MQPGVALVSGDPPSIEIACNESEYDVVCQEWEHAKNIAGTVPVRVPGLSGRRGALRTIGRVIGGAVLVLLLAAIGWLFAKGLYDAEVETRTTIIAASAVLITGILTHRQTKKREIEARHFGQKADAYMEFVNFFISIAQSGAPSTCEAKKELAGQLIDIRKKLWIWSSPDMIHCWNVYWEGLSDSTKPKSERDMLLTLESVIRAMRRDLGHDDRQLGEGEIIDVIMAEGSKLKDLTERSVEK